MNALTTVITERWQTSIPARIRQQLHLKPGQKLRWQTVADHECRVFPELSEDTPSPPAALPIPNAADNSKNRKVDAEPPPTTLENAPDPRLANLGLAAPSRNPPKRQPERGGITGRNKILIVEDDRVIAMALTLLLQDAGQEVIQAFDALTNVARHAHATAVEGELRTEADVCFLEIRDNGRGMAGISLAKPNSLGLLGMRERAALLGGGVSFGPRPGGGTVVTVRIPNASAGKDGA